MLLKKHPFIKKLIFSIGVILCFFVVFIVVYAPVIQKGYFYLDDYAYFRHDKPSLSFFMDESFREGRVLEGPILYLISTFIETSESTKTIRFIGIIGIALLASVICAVFRRVRFRYDQAFLMSTLICLLPFMQIFASWMIIMPSIYSALLSSLSALLLFNIVFEKGKKPAYSVIRVLTAVFLLLTALSINQPPAMMYWAMGIIFFITDDNFDFSNKERRRQAIRYFLVGFFSMVIYFIVFIKLIPFVMNISISRGNLVSIQDISQRFTWFLTGPVMRTMNLWNANPTYKFAAFIGVIICSGIILNLLQVIREQDHFSVINFFIRYSLISAIVLLCYLPKLMIIEPTYVQAYWFRTLISIATAIFILFLFEVINIIEFFKFIPNFSAELRKTTITLLLTILTIIAAFSAHNNVNYFSTLYSTELNHITTTIKNYGVSNLINISKIYIRRPTTRGFPENDRFNEFKGALNTAPKEGMIKYVIKRALHDVGVKPEEVQITHGAPDDPIPSDKIILIVDMTAIELLDKYMKVK